MTHPVTDVAQWDEAERLNALASYEILDTEPEQAFDEVVQLIARICEAPIAVVNLIDADRQWFKAEVGLGVRETPLATSFCAQALLLEDGMQVSDATTDVRFACNPLVTGEPYLRFYAGQLLKTQDGLPLGTLCVLDTKPRPEGLTEVQAMALKTLAGQVMTQLELRRTLRQRAKSEETTRRALAASNYIGAWDWDVSADRIVADERFANIYGVEPRLAAQGAPLSAFLRNVHADDAARVEAEIAALLSTGGAYLSEYRIMHEVNGERWIQARGHVYLNDEGVPVRFPGVASDVTARRRQDAHLAEAVLQLADSEARFRSLADAMPQMVWSSPPDGRPDYYNARWYAFTGTTPGSSEGQGWENMVHKDDRRRGQMLWEQALLSGDPYEVEYRLKHNAGGYRWTLARAEAARNDAGEVTRWFGSCTDIDHLKRLEHERELVSQELSHRIKNIFAVVSALVALSARQHPEARGFAKSLRTRINALARAHEFVRPHTETSQTTVGVTTLHAFFNDLFGAYADDHGEGRVRISGEDTVFDDQSATSVALLFHELATNAAKHGALSTPSGRVDLNTRNEGDRFILIWQETGGPPIYGEPKRNGFGSSLATLSVETQLGGRLEREWRPEGLRMIIDLPAAALSRRRAAVKFLRLGQI
nr:PAS domain-containing protein [uncultured Brevundimonas sp.]